MPAQSKDKEVDGLRRLAELLRQAHAATTESRQKTAKIKKLKRGQTPRTPMPRDVPPKS